MFLILVIISYIILDKWISSDIEEMSSALREYNELIGDGERWKMDLSKRRYEKHSTTELIRTLTESIEKEKVDLKKPEKIVKVEIFGDRADVDPVF